MDRHLSAEEVQSIADGELEMAPHAEQCLLCASAVIGAQQLKRAVRRVMQDEHAPPSQWRAAVLRGLAATDARNRWWMPAAAALAVVVLSGALLAHMWSRNIRSELIDMHVTLLNGANPIDVVSTDRHTVRPWFEGRVPFAVPLPDLSPTPFRLIGGRVVFWRGHPGAYLLIGKGAHRISVFVFRDEDAPEVTSGSFRGISTVAWHQDGLKLAAVADLPSSDLEPLRAAFGR